MTVAELTERLKSLPQDAEIGTGDDFGDLEEIYYVAAPTADYEYVRLYITRGAVVED